MRAFFKSLLGKASDLSEPSKLQPIPHESPQPKPPILIWKAIEDGDLEELRRLFRENPDEIDGYTFFGGGTYLHYAAAHSATPAVLDLLIELGFNVNKPGQNWGDVALCSACAEGRADLAECLLDHGSIMDVSDTATNPLFSSIVGYQPHWEPPRESFLDVVRLLLARGIDVTPRYTGKRMIDMDAMAFATIYGRVDIAEAIAEHLHGDDNAAVAASLDEAELIARGNATGGKAFRREREALRQAKPS